MMQTRIAGINAMRTLWLFLTSRAETLSKQ